MLLRHPVPAVRNARDSGKVEFGAISVPAVGVGIVVLAVEWVP